MEEKVRRHLTPEQNFAMLQGIETYPTVKEGLGKCHLSHLVYQKWKRQLVVGCESLFGTTRR